MACTSAPFVQHSRAVTQAVCKEVQPAVQLLARLAGVSPNSSSNDTLQLALSSRVSLRSADAPFPAPDPDCLPSTSGLCQGQSTLSQLCWRQRGRTKQAMVLQQPRLGALRGFAAAALGMQTSLRGTTSEQRSPLAMEISSIFGLAALDEKLSDDVLARFDGPLLVHTVNHIRSLCAAQPHLISAENSSYESVTQKLTTTYAQLLNAAGGLGLTPFEAVSVLHTFAEMGFVIGGNFEGVKNLSEFFRTHVLLNMLAPPIRSDGLQQRLLQHPSLAVDLLWAFARQFDAASRADREEELARRRKLQEAAEGAGGMQYGAPMHHEQQDPAAVLGNGQLFVEVCQRLVPHVASLPTRYLSKLCQALALVNCVHYGVLQRAVETTHARLADIPIASLANMLDHLGRLNFSCVALCDEVARQYVGRMGVMQVRHLATLTRAFARLRYENVEWMRRASHMFQVRLEDCGPPELAKVAWSFATRSVQDPKLFDALAARMARSIELAKPRDIAAMLHAFAKAHHDSSLLMSVCEKAMMAGMDSYTPQQLANSMRAFTTLGYQPQQLYTRAMQHTQALLSSPDTRMELTDQNAADLAYAYAFALMAAPHQSSPAAAEGPGEAGSSSDGGGGSAGSPEGLVLADAPQLFRMLTDRVLELRELLGKTSMVDLATAYTEGGLKDERMMVMLQEVCEVHLADMGPLYLGRIMRAYGLVKDQVPVSSRFWEGCLDAITLKWGSCQRYPDAVANMRWAVQVVPATSALLHHPALQLLGVHMPPAHTAAAGATPST